MGILEISFADGHFNKMGISINTLSIPPPERVVLPIKGIYKEEIASSSVVVKR